MKAPLIFAGPEIKQGATDALVYLMDIYPTVASLVHAPAPDDLDGIDLTEVLQNGAARPRSTLGLAYRDVQRAIRDERYKLIRYPQINKTQLFDLERDPDEMNDLSGDASHAERIEQLMTALEAWQRDLGDGCALTSPQPRDPAFIPPIDDAPAVPRKGAKSNNRSADRS